MTENKERLVEYFRGREEVSSLYLFGQNGGAGVAVLLKDAGLSGDGLDAMVKKYLAACLRILDEPVEVVVLNAAPAALKFHVLKAGEVLLERNVRFREWFAEQAINEYLDHRLNAANEQEFREERREAVEG